MLLKQAFRQKFSRPNVESAGWFARHMFNSIVKMERKLKSVDCIIEVHDARIPFSGRNPALQQKFTAAKPHLLVFNKMDLAEKSMFPTISKFYKDRGVSEVIFTNCKNIGDGGIEKVLPTVVDLIQNSERYNREDRHENMVMIVGIPNVGKSSLINKLRYKYMKRGKATIVGALPGVTRTVLEKIKISEDPLIYLLDTPGISAPKMPDMETGLRLGLCAILQDHIVGEELLADYLLFWLNKHNNFSYVDYLGVEEPSDNITEVLLKHAIKNDHQMQAFFQGRRAIVPDILPGAKYFIGGFRRGNLGNFMLDDDKF